MNELRWRAGKGAIMDSANAGLIGALIGSAAVLVGQVLSNHHQRRLAQDHWRRDRYLKQYQQLHSLYVSTLANFEKCIRATQELRDYAEITAELPRLNARLQLVAPKEIIDQAEVASQALYHWSAEFRRGAPKKVEGTSLSILSSTDFPHQEKARALYPAINDAIVKLAELMKTHLRKMQPDDEQGQERIVDQ